MYVCGCVCVSVCLYLLVCVGVCVFVSAACCVGSLPFSGNEDVARGEPQIKCRVANACRPMKKDGMLLPSLCRHVIESMQPGG